MSYLTLTDSAGVVSNATAALITTPYAGVWQADVSLDAQTAPSGRCALTISDLNAVWSGTVIPTRAGAAFGMVGLRMIGGAAGLSKMAIPQAFQGNPIPVSFGNILNALLAQGGETIASTADSGILATNLTGWCITARPLLRNLIWLCESAAPANSIYRSLMDGTIWVGPGTFESYPGQYKVLEHQPQESMVVLSDITQPLLPGMTIAEGNVDHIVMDIRAHAIRVQTWLQ